MAKIINLANGTMGDILPYIALGQALQKKGHQVQMISPEYIHPQIIAGKLSVQAGLHQKVNPEKIRKSALLWDSWITNPEELAAKRELNRQYHSLEKWRGMSPSVSELLELGSDAEAIICNPQEEFVGAILAEKLAIPLIRVVVTPQLIYQPNSWWRLSLWGKLKNDPRDLYHKFRSSLGLKDPESWQKYWQGDRLILAASPHLYQNPPDVSEVNHVGFFFYNNPEWQQWQPSPDLKQFVESDAKPLVLSFSSQPMRNAEEFIAIHARAAAILERKIIIQRGLAELAEKHLPADIPRDLVKFIDFMPQDWLFSHAAAVITHGGIGTVARALLNGCPLLVEPNTHEQCFNAHRVLNWGIGAAVHPKKITPEGIATVLAKKVLTPEYKLQAETIKLRLQQEESLEKAVVLIESYLSNKD